MTFKKFLWPTYNPLTAHQLKITVLEVILYVIPYQSHTHIAISSHTSGHLGRLGWPANPCCRQSAQAYLCFFNTQRAHSWCILRLWWVELSYNFGGGGRFREITCDQQFEHVKYTWTLGHDDFGLCASTTIDSF